VVYSDVRFFPPFPRVLLATRPTHSPFVSSFLYTSFCMGGVQSRTKCPWGGYPGNRHRGAAENRYEEITHAHADVVRQVYRLEREKAHIQRQLVQLQEVVVQGEGRNEQAGEHKALLEIRLEGLVQSLEQVLQLSVQIGGEVVDARVEKEKEYVETTVSRIRGDTKSMLYPVVEPQYMVEDISVEIES
jgi:hypothetical protein